MSKDSVDAGGRREGYGRKLRRHRCGSANKNQYTSYKENNSRREKRTSELPTERRVPHMRWPPLLWNCEVESVHWLQS